MEYGTNYTLGKINYFEGLDFFLVWLQSCYGLSSVRGWSRTLSSTPGALVWEGGGFPGPTHDLHLSGAGWGSLLKFSEVFLGSPSIKQRSPFFLGPQYPLIYSTWATDPGSGT